MKHHSSSTKGTFEHGIASGDPTYYSIIILTKITPSSLHQKFLSMIMF
jgi:phosphodiesterase/alkaline phosphatase D-like protein